MGIEFVAAKDQAGQKSDSDDGGEHSVSLQLSAISRQ